MTKLSFTGWKAFSARKDKKVINNWLSAVAEKSEKTFSDGMQGSHTGRIYRRRGRTHQASAAGEYPANDTGKLLKSLKTNKTQNSVTIGTNQYYAKFLREGTRIMQRRKMSDNALQEGAKEARPISKGWVKWLR